MDIVTTVIFIGELLIKVIAAGFACNGPKSYIRSFWHVLDFFIVLVSIIGLVNLGSKITFLKIIRMARLLRPLKIISKNENLKMSINALVVSIPAIASLMVIVLLFMFIFAIMGVSLFKGKSFYCDTDAITGLSQREIETLIMTKADCISQGGRWGRYHSHFDNVFNSLLYFLVMS